jgi:single-stranded-DNA-specific exonuclease
LSECRDLFVRFGGHRTAAGVTIAASRVEEFAERFNRVAAACLTPDDLVPEVRIDLEVPLAEVTMDLEALLRHFEPFGAGNSTPVLLSRGVRLAQPPRVVGQGHLKLRLAGDGVELDAIGWGLGRLAPDLVAGTTVDVAFRLERDDWNGQQRLQAKLADIRR